jgi:hypothetical protein
MDNHQSNIATTAFREVPIDQIVVSDDHQIDWALVEIIAQSIRMVRSESDSGLINPVVLNANMKLLNGHHRYLAMKQIGIETIPAQIKVVGDAERLVAIDDDLLRRDLHPLDRAKLFAERKRLYQIEHPDAKRGGNKKKGEGPKAFADWAKDIKGLSKGKVNGLVRLGEAFTDDQIEILKKRNVKQVECRDIAAQDPADIGDIVAEIDAGTKALDAICRVRNRKKVIAFPVPHHQALTHGDYAAAVDLDEAPKLIMTDPPYVDEFVVQEEGYAKLGEWAERVLPDGGWLVTYIGTTHLPEVIEQLSRHLKYRWTCTVVHEDSRGRIQHGIGAIPRCKYLLVFSKGTPRSIRMFKDVIQGRKVPAKERIHKWQQGMELGELLEAFTDKGDLVADPFCGSGTIPAMCLQKGRRYVSWEIDHDYYLGALKRIADAEQGRESGDEGLAVAA